MTTTHFAIVRDKRKAPSRRCIGVNGSRCAQLTRHKSQRCPAHRGLESRRAA